MVQSVTIPLSWANNIPGVSGVSDVAFDVPQVTDIESAVEDTVPSEADLRTFINEEVQAVLGEELDLDGLVDQIVADVADELEAVTGLDIPTVEEIADAVGDQLDIPDLSDIEVNIDGSLFAVNEDFVDLLATALDQVDFLDVDQLGDVEGLIEDVEAVLDQVEPLLDLSEADLIQRATEEAEAVLEDVLPDWVLMDLDELQAELRDRLADFIVSEEAIKTYQELTQDLTANDEE